MFPNKIGKEKDLKRCMLVNKLSRIFQKLIIRIFQNKLIKDDLIDTNRNVRLKSYKIKIKD